MTFCERLREIRKGKNLTQKQVAEAIHTIESNYQRYESGKQQPTLPVLIAMANCLDVSLDYLVGLSDDTLKHESTPDGLSKGDMIFLREKLIERFKALREGKSISQKQLAAELNLVKQTVGNWETGYRIPPLETLWQLADYFGVSLDYLVGRSDDPSKH